MSREVPKLQSTVQTEEGGHSGQQDRGVGSDPQKDEG